MTTNYLVVVLQRLLALDNGDTLLSPLNNFKVSMMSMISIYLLANFKYQILNIKYLLSPLNNYKVSMMSKIIFKY